LQAFLQKILCTICRQYRIAYVKREALPFFSVTENGNLLLNGTYRITTDTQVGKVIGLIGIIPDILMGNLRDQK
jgi:hypothetical protein